MPAANYVDGFGAPAGSATTATIYVPKYNVDPAYVTNVTNWIAAATAKKPKTNIPLALQRAASTIGSRLRSIPPNPMRKAHGLLSLQLSPATMGHR